MPPLPSSFLPQGDAAVSATERAFPPLALHMEDSQIRRVAQEVWNMEAKGVQVCNFTIGDFRPWAFPVPQAFLDRMGQELLAGQTNYTPSDGIPELRQSIADQYERELGLDFGPDGVLVAAGARPIMYAIFRCFLEQGDGFAHGVPSWNTHYYVYLTKTRHFPIITDAASRFLPTAEQVQAIIGDIRLLILNSPLNPTGTGYRADELRAVCQVVLQENLRREAAGQRPVMLVYDQVYWTLAGEQTPHVHPLGLVPELAPWTLYVDAISKSLAATGLRVGWGMVPPHLKKPLKSYLGHLGAFAPRPEQRATAWYLQQQDIMAQDRAAMKAGIRQRLDILVKAALAMQAEGLPVEIIPPEGGIYLSIRFALHGMTTAQGARLDNNEDIRRFLLEQARMAVVPFQAFGLEAESGWFRISVGAARLEEQGDAMAKVREAISGCA